MMRFATQGLVAQPTGVAKPIHEWGYGANQEHANKIEAGWYKAERENPEVGLMGPAEFNKWKRKQEPQDQVSNNDFTDTRQRVDNYLTASSWITPLRKRWIDHTSGKNPITDPVYRKELQDIILYPERTGLPMKGV